MPNIGFWATAGAGGGANWLTSISTSNHGPFSLYGDTTGNPYVVGHDFTSGHGKGFLVSLTSSGAGNWAKTLTDTYSSPYTESRSVLVDDAGNVYVGGNMKNSSGGTDVFIAKYNSSGTIQWQKNIYNSNQSISVRNDILWSMCFNSNQTNIYFVGRGPYSGVTSYGVAFLGSLAISTQTLNWSRLFYYPNASADSTALTVCSDSSNNFYFGGQFSWGVNILGYTTKLDSSGTLQWVKSLNNANNNLQVTSCAVDTSGNVYSGGWAYIGGNSVGFIAKYNSSGTIQWQKYFNTLNGSHKLKIDTSGNIYVVGNKDGSRTYYYVKLDSSGSILYQGSITASTNYFYAYNTVQSNNFIFDAADNFVLLANNGLGTRTYVTKFPAGAAYVKTVSAFSDTITYAASALTIATSSMTDGSPAYSLTSNMSIQSSSMTDATYSPTYEKVSI